MWSTQETPRHHWWICYPEPGDHYLQHFAFSLAKHLVDFAFISVSLCPFILYPQNDQFLEFLASLVVIDAVAEKMVEPFIHPTAVVHPDATLGQVGLSFLFFWLSLPRFFLMNANWNSSMNFIVFVYSSFPPSFSGRLCQLDHFVRLGHWQNWAMPVNYILVLMSLGVLNWVITVFFWRE